MTKEQRNLEITILRTPPRFWETRCRVCGWSLAKSVEEGCIRLGTQDLCCMTDYEGRGRADATTDYTNPTRWPILLADLPKPLNIRVFGDCCELAFMDIAVMGCGQFREATLPELICEVWLRCKQAGAI